MKTKRLTWFSFSIFSAGCLFDHFTTVYGLGIEGVNELNSFVTTLQEHGLWEFSELIVISLGLVSALLSSKTEATPTMKSCFLFLMVTGLIRLAIAIQNFAIILNASVI